ncbi:flagellar basal body rod protein FlgC [Pseudooceanicola sediminis]|uniref:Flagellar basal body rod protein FlgB n=1 Tax=Pseudooceanicola sediminis TaxID=2211117 RepID=A0A399J4Q2_9RHOB|nr:flagellar basal body rod protein FlgC [Pseudooceanicola sediminis]KAA2315569.1 flagellar basal body rod protein FlgC [Puniceibacterium sp. HSS470]RII40230.1 flagellar basal body rod protein FlgC [Pseudooceanicola sediminis]|tara:strand:- start:16629 stop:17021 length:393 start_codon:yes stop_codon:yes gene_type:complete
MGDFLNSMSVSATGLRAQAERLQHTSENIANADTPGYRRKTVPFESVAGSDDGAGEVRTGRVKLDQSELVRIYDPSHPLADETGHHDGSNVDLVVEIADAREAQRSYEANLKMFDQARQMSASLLELLRR